MLQPEVGDLLELRQKYRNGIPLSAGPSAPVLILPRFHIWGTPFPVDLLPLLLGKFYRKV